MKLKYNQLKIANYTRMYCVDFLFCNRLNLTSLYYPVLGLMFSCTVLMLVFIVGDVVALWLACWTPDQEVRVRALVGSLCCVLGQHFTLTVPLSFQD